jgi:UDP-N-acetylglucosamine--N-acetylmuramyl-(pentapeptide) pyrophosphoryl-undecaprenol N-acetylglucosamine transferase
MQPTNRTPLVAVACGGTGGHLFPGLAVAEALQAEGCDITLLVSAKDVDQEGVKSAMDMDVVTLPAVALQNGDVPGFLQGFWKSFRICSSLFRKRRPQAVLAMGGFTSAPPVLAGKFSGASTFLHESNAIPGRANRWLSPLVRTAFVGFPAAARRLHNQSVTMTGTPVRSQFSAMEPAACRMALGLQPDRPVLLVMGGSQGASGINGLVAQALPMLSMRAPDLQFLHLTGEADQESIRSLYQSRGVKAVVRPFLTEMELALGAATVAVSRAGASSLAEIAAMQLPAILIPYPFAADNHQFLNARAFLESGAARQMDQASATPEMLTSLVAELIENSGLRASMRRALQKSHFPEAAHQIAERILGTIREREPKETAREGEPSGGLRTTPAISGAARARKL